MASLVVGFYPGGGRRGRSKRGLEEVGGGGFLTTHPLSTVSNPNPHPPDLDAHPTPCVCVCVCVPHTTHRACGDESAPEHLAFI